jgi:hypothetical protein
VRVAEEDGVTARRPARRQGPGIGADVLEFVHGAVILADIGALVPHRLAGTRRVRRHCAAHLPPRALTVADQEREPARKLGDAALDTHRRLIPGADVAGEDINAREVRLHPVGQRVPVRPDPVVHSLGEAGINLARVLTQQRE